MKKTLIALVPISLLLFVACACQPHSNSSSRKINLGKQLTAITLTSGSNNDVNIAPTGGTTTLIRFTPNASGSTLSGMNSSQVVDGDLFLLRNEGTSASITITNADTNSVAANRFTTQNGLSLVLPPHGAVWAEWDGTASAWILSPGYSIGDLAIGGTGVVGHLRNPGTAPALTSCGTSPSIAGGDLAGVVTTGSGATTCTITFARTFTTAPSCYFLPTGTATMPVYTVSATAITVTTDIASTVYNYGCVGQ